MKVQPKKQYCFPEETGGISRLNKDSKDKDSLNRLHFSRPEIEGDTEIRKTKSHQNKGTRTREQKKNIEEIEGDK